MKVKKALQNHSAIYVWGKAYELVITECSGYSKISLDNGYMMMRIRRNSKNTKKQETLDRFFRRILEKAALPIIEKWEDVLKVKVTKLYIRKMKTHWGSCSYAKHSIRLNSELAKRSPECLEYVIVHEMLHIIQKGHGRDFYDLLNNYVPEWKMIRKNLNAVSI